MKLLIPIIFTMAMLWLPPIAVTAQENIRLENKQIIFEKKYAIDSLSADKIKTLLSSTVPAIKGVVDYYDGGTVITAKLKDASIDFRKYGGKWANTATYVQYPFSAGVTIIWKDGAYKVTVSNLVFHLIKELGDAPIEEVVTKKKGTELSSANTVTKSLEYIDKYFTELFSLNVSAANW